MTDSAQIFVLISRSGIDIHADAREMPGQGFGGYAEAIGKSGDLVEFGRIFLFGAD